MMNVELMNKPENIQTDGGSTIMDINELPYFDEFQYDFMDEKSYKRVEVHKQITIDNKKYTYNFNMKLDNTVSTVKYNFSFILVFIL